MKRLAITHEITPATAAAFADRIKASGHEELEVLIDCPGGDVDAAFAMANAIHAAKGHTTAILLRADSAALFVSLGADRRIAARDGTALLHNTTIEVPGRVSVTAGELRTAAANTERTQLDVSRALELETSTPTHLWQRLMAGNTRLNAEAMLKHRLVSAISPWSKARLRAPHLWATSQMYAMALIQSYSRRTES